MTIFRHMVLTAAIAVAVPAQAAPQFEDLSKLETRLTATLGADIGEPGGPSRPIDRRLKLAVCPEPAMITTPRPSAALVRCGPIGWRIHVPLIQAARAQPAVVAKPAPVEPAVRKGDEVEVVATGDGFTVSTVAIAQEDGLPGERIHVSTDRKLPPFTAEVQSKGRVVVARFK